MFLNFYFCTFIIFCHDSKYGSYIINCTKTYSYFVWESSDIDCNLFFLKVWSMPHDGSNIQRLQHQIFSSNLSES